MFEASSLSWTDALRCQTALHSVKLENHSPYLFFISIQNNASCLHMHIICIFLQSHSLAFLVPQHWSPSFLQTVFLLLSAHIFFNPGGSM